MNMIKDGNSYNFSSAEKQVKKLWEVNHYFEKLMRKNQNGERFRFLDGPITANNAMGIHHAFGRTLKDITLKYNSMKGRSCQFQNGFDAQGLWVEVEVEKQLCFGSKKDIVDYGLDHFTNACMERVQTYAKVITEQSKDLGQWMDWDNSYFTNTDQNILGIWHFLKKCDERGWIAKKHRVMPWCPRCGTSLSEHEMSGSYSEVTCQSVFFKLPLDDEQADLLVWTTTPWTLTANAAVAVNPDLEYAYVKVKSMTRLLICCKTALGILKDDKEKVVKLVKGSELIGKTYTTCFPEFESQKFVHTIIPWEAVAADEGTGLVHIAPGCGAEDFELGLKYNVPRICPINESGIITEEFGAFAGKSTIEVAKDIFSELNERCSLYYVMDYTHKYAHCWRCKTDIVFKLVDEWYIRTDEIRPQLLAAVETVKWQPEHIKKRMVDWLNNMSDWNISRKRFYGLPLPFYVCNHCGKVIVIGSKEELIQRSSREAVEQLPHFHRPWIDNIAIRCDCGATVKRITEVGDCWLDAGITPFVTKKYFTDKEYWKANFPNEIVIEMVEQIRLWFYSMLFMSVTLEGCAPYQKVVAYGSVVREDGEKFSKSAGKDRNIVLGDAIEKIGADTIRYLYAGTTSVNDLRFGFSLGDDAKKRILAFWNTYAFFDLYAQLDNPQLEGFTPTQDVLEPSDLWAIQLLNRFVAIAEQGYSNQLYLPILKEFEQLIDDINNWYIRINRRRFWKDHGKNKQVAYWVLYQVIKITSQIMAPIIPFITDFIWHDMVIKFEPTEAESIHLSNFPVELPFENGEDIIDKTRKVREIISLVQKLRNDKKIMVKQPLQKLCIVGADEYKQAVNQFIKEMTDEINVKEILFVEDEKEFIDTHLSVNFVKAGAVLKQNVNKFKAYLSEITQEQKEYILEELRRNNQVWVERFDIPLTTELFSIDAIPKTQYAMAVANDLKLFLDTNVTEQLYAEFKLRTFIRKVQVLRKEKGFKVESHIRIQIHCDDQLFKNIVYQNLKIIKEELLIDSFEEVSDLAEHDRIAIDDMNIKIVLREIVF
jgi:isoleucyl-tRNA synthetase